MFRSIELGQCLDKAAFRHAEEQLRPRLIEAQHAMKEQGLPLLIVIGGLDAAGKGDTVNLLMEWMDPRLAEVRALGRLYDYDAERPYFFRFWRRIPPRGRTGIFLGSWYTPPILDRVHGRIGKGKLDRTLDQIIGFEQMLHDDGVLLLKFWMHLSRKDQRAKLEALEKDQTTRWRVTKQDWKHHKMYDRFRDVCERSVLRTSTGDCPWVLVEGKDLRFQGVQVVENILEAVEPRLEEGRKKTKRPARKKKTLDPVPRQTVLDTMDLSLALSKNRYERDLKKYQGKMNRLARALSEKGRTAVLVFEGCDAAGKGGAIRRLAHSMHARTYRIIPIAAPTQEEHSYPYMWRFWKCLPGKGTITIFDRSWYGRVLVERVEGFCSESDWRRAYREIREFEEQLVAHGVGVRKFWLQISEEEQLRRFEARQDIAWKRHKITDEDWRNREKWPQYKEAISEMIERTDTHGAPWVLVEAEDKRWARVKVLRSVCELVEELV